MLSSPGNLSQGFSPPQMQTVLGTLLKRLPEPKCTHPQRAAAEPEQLRQALAVPDLFPLVTLIIGQDQIPILGGELAQASPQALSPIFGILRRFMWGALRFRRFIEGAGG